MNHKTMHMPDAIDIIIRNKNNDGIFKSFKNREVVSVEIKTESFEYSSNFLFKELNDIPCKDELQAKLIEIILLNKKTPIDELVEEIKDFSARDKHAMSCDDIGIFQELMKELISKIGE